MVTANIDIESFSFFKLTDYKLAIEQADIIAFLVAHDEFKKVEILSEKVVLDFCGVLNK